MFEWFGNEVARITREAAEEAVDQAVEKAVTGAINRVHVITGNLRDSIERKDETRTEEEYSVRFGSEVDYAIYEELLHPYLRPEADIAVAEMKVKLK